MVINKADRELEKQEKEYGKDDKEETTMHESEKPFIEKMIDYIKVRFFQHSSGKTSHLIVLLHWFSCPRAPQKFGLKPSQGEQTKFFGGAGDQRLSGGARHPRARRGPARAQDGNQGQRSAEAVRGSRARARAHARGVPPLKAGGRF